MNIAICEDNKTQSDLIKQMVRNWSIKGKNVIKITCYQSAEAFLFCLPEDGPFDILLLDIQMKEMTGIDLAKQLRETKDEVIIIFITAMKEYVFEGYNVDALQYLLKPIKETSLFECLDKAVDKLKKQEQF